MKRYTAILILLASALSMCARQPQKGYRGFIEWSNDLRSEQFASPLSRESLYYSGVTTTHGYQINQLFFVGAGIGLEHCRKMSNWVAPLFLEGRLDLKFGKFTPYASVRAGANLADGVGMYFSPSIGYRFNWGRKVALNIGAGLTLAGYRVELYSGDIYYDDPLHFEIKYLGRVHRVHPYFAFRAGFEF